MESNPIMPTMPSNVSAEQSILSLMFFDQQNIPKIFEKLTPDDFYKEAHRIIFEAAETLFNRDTPFDLILLQDYLHSKGLLEKVGGLSYLTRLATLEQSAALLDSYLDSVGKKTILRRLILASDQIQKNSFERQDEPAEVLEDAERRIFEIAEKRQSRDFVPMNLAVERGLLNIENMYVNKGQLTGVPSPFPALNEKTAGFQPGDMVLIAARPSMGKTTFALNLAEYAALKEGKSVAIFSLEMSTDQLAYKLLCSQAGVDMNKMRLGDLNESDWDNIARVTGPLSKARIFIDDTAGISVMEMKSKARRLKLEHGLDMIVIDYLQLMSGKGDNRQQEVSEISRSIKILAKELEVPVLTLSQLSRAPEQRTDHRPMLSDLRESGSIEQDADLVMFLYRDEYYNKETETPGMAECIIAKQRNGPIGTVPLAWVGKFSRFGIADIVHGEE
ncbi:Replicative DNA helicase (DnaB) [Clostridiaceae bacterium JG1575]|nr:Replicative DNA helicase (DnaB) [Clostridiaceae bacterium JG1575]